MLGRIAIGVLAMCCLAAATPASASLGAPAIDIRAQPLSSALQELARDMGVELLFDQSLTAGRRAPHIRGRYNLESALQQLLTGSGLTFRRAASGAWLIVAAPALRPPPPPPPQELAAPEILVIGKRSQNFDIRRREDDIQPYDVSLGPSIVRAHVDNTDEYFRSRVTANTEFVSPTLLTTGATNSEINLRGLGADTTLVLIDGRRMPGIPATYLELGQPDLNAIPLHSIDRIETLTGTAGGIFGFGALGGVVNVILKRNYRGAELNLTGGITSRGDARHLDIEGRIGFTPDGGRTDVMLYLSHTWSEPLLVGQRAFMSRNIRDFFRLDGQLDGFVNSVGNSVGVNSLFGDNLTFKPQFGGTTLSSSYTFLPTGFSGNNSDLVASLTQNAGQTDLTFTPRRRASDLHSNPNVSAAVLSLRHHFSDTIEAYLDGLFLRNHGHHLNRAASGSLLLDPNSPYNPFTQYIAVQFPQPGALNSRVNVDSERLTAGIIVQFPFDWRGTGELTFGATRFDQLQSGVFTLIPFLAPLDPLGNWSDFEQSLAAFQATDHTESHPTNYYQEQLLQVAGPLFRTASGPAVLNLSLERHQEDVGAYTDAGTDDLGESFSNMIPPHVSTTDSVHAELNTKVFGSSAPFFLLRGLELQLAAHFDSEKVSFSADPSMPEAPPVRKTFAGAAFTAGAKTQPLPWLMLRGSFATGRQPPPLADLISGSIPSDFTFATDPKRGNTYTFLEPSFIVKIDGSPNLSALQASTLSLGTVLSPLPDRSFRFSLDYSRIRKNHDVFLFPFNDVQPILDRESSLPGRVMRAPLTDEDRALGYTGGLIIGIDATATNQTRVKVDTLDARLEWTVPAVRGKLHIYGAATWQIRNLEQGLFGPAIEHVGFVDGPLKWRANGGFDWARGALTIGANLQYFGRYHVGPDSVSQSEFRDVQGSNWVHSQFYLDAYVDRRIEIGRVGRERFLDINLGINNLLDATPPREASFLLDSGYSRFGDPRLRRIELGVTLGF